MARKMQRGEWQGYLDRVSKGLGAQQAELEVAALGLGAQIAHEWAPVRGISYDPKGDLMDVILEELDHRIARPSEIWIEERAGGLANLDVVDGEGRHHLVKLRAPLALPAP